ncbi:Uncharacterised protein g11218 [Pycnogonum litorale]
MSSVVIFHSYSNGPCLDGLLSAFFYALYGPDRVLALVPHSRGERQERIISDAINKSVEFLRQGEKLTAKYLDIGPVDSNELNSVASEADLVHVTDHHRLDVQVESIENGSVEIDLNLCVAAQVT